jgi:EAL domain-containing protein (putative c-di-GMP-specific phosphodiesterase class I)
MAVNVSPRQLADPAFPDLVAGILRETGNARRALLALKQLGIRLAIDDFGVGFASLSQLKSLLPLHTLKIDKSFVDRVTGDGEDRAIMEAILRLASSLDLVAVAEGVEDADQAAVLLAMGCDVAQGFHFARPQAAEAVGALLAAAPAAA